MRRWFVCLGAGLLAASISLPVAARSFTEALQHRLTTGVGAPKADQDGQTLALLGRFYEGRKFAPVWIEGNHPSARAGALLAVLKSADADGLDPKDYGVGRIGTLLERGDSPDALAELEVLLSAGAVGFGRDLGSGRLEPSQVDAELFVQRREVKPGPLLDKVAAAPDPAAVLRPLAPKRPEYAGLKAALVRYRALAAAGGWPQVPSEGETLKPGQSDARVPPLRQRLRVTGELPAESPDPADPLLYDPLLESAVRRFQQEHGLEPDGAVGKGTFAALNVPVDQRIGQIVLNMERWRWMPDDLGPRYLMVNLAAFSLAVFENGHPIHKARVVVGAPYTRTPVFSESMTYLELNPYWHVPAKIAEKEIFPKARKDPAYLTKHGYVLLSDWTESAVPLPPGSIDYARLGLPGHRFRVRQEPGDQNSLGRIKLMFPNQFDVYLHDTPSKTLFSRANRTFSHGCIRVENPFDLAELILRLTGTTGWDRARLDQVVASNVRTVVRLKSALPVHLTYITAFVEEDGTVNFRGDIYGRDRKLAAALLASRIHWPQVAAEAATVPGHTDGTEQVTPARAP